MTTTQKNAIAACGRLNGIRYNAERNFILQRLNVDLIFNNKYMTTTPTNGIAIEPVVFPLNQGTATRMTILVLNFETTATTCQTYWQLLTEDGQQLSQGNYTLTEEQFASWGQDNNVVNEYVAEAIGVTIIS